MIVLSDDDVEIGIYPGRCIEVNYYKKRLQRSIKWSDVRSSGILRYLTERLMSQLTYELNGFAFTINNFKQIEDERRLPVIAEDEKPAHEEVLEKITKKYYLKSREVETLYGISASTLANWRHKKVGPTYHKVGGSVRYKAEDLDQFMEDRKVRIE